MNRLVITFPCVLLALLWSRPTAAQSDTKPFQIGGQLAGALSSEFDNTDFGVGGRFSWHPASILGAEAELDFYPAGFPGKPAFSRGRVEGLFGVTVGPRIGRLRIFAKLRPGFVTFREASEPFACILIFPPPLACTLAAGDTLFAVDVGGGVELFPTDRTFIRMEAGDRALRYPRLVLDTGGTVRESAFFSHDFRFAIGGGLRF